ncbi:MAG TPA: choice-of-anchor D domain-containing protein [Bryobacteraceae bacterium]|nr:choice-of-anchor D domain-containing protein [Bryobacteraceae bacterium]
MKTPLTLSLLFAVLAPAQSFLIRVQQDNEISQVANGGSVTVNAAGANQPRNLNVIITYTGTGNIRFQGAPTILGSTDFTITSPPSASSLSPNQSLVMELRYLPLSGRQAKAELDLAFQETNGSTGSSDPSITSGLLVLGLTGTAPEFALNYGFAADGNVVNVPPGGTLAFAETATTTTSLATIILANRGSGSGHVLSASVTGEAFSLLSLPLLPATLQAAERLQFQLRYRPMQPGTDVGTLTLAFENGASYTVNLKGIGTASLLSFDLLPPEGAVQPMSPNAAVVIPATPVGEKTTVFIRMRNNTSQDIPVGAIAISGNGYQLADLPFLPLVSSPGSVQVFSIIFTPARGGVQSGRLLIGTTAFNLSGTGIGPLLSYSYRSISGTVSVQPLSTIELPSTPIGQTSTAAFTIRNSGTAPAPIASIFIAADGRSPFTIMNGPALPAAIAPDSSLTITIGFAPLTAGAVTASLRIGSDAFTLSGVSNQLQPLPDYTITGPDTVNAFEQPTLSLTIAEPYPVDLTGSLTLSTESDRFTNDPSVLFVTGGKAATFTIPAGTTKAVFSNNATGIRFQTGSVAGMIVATPSFAAGGAALTPPSPKQYRASLAASAPVISSLSIDSKTGSSFTLQAVGFTTTRSLSKLTVSVKGKSGYNFSGTEFTIDLSGNSYLWFNASSSSAFGGQFILQLPVTLSTSDNSSSATPPVQAIETITATLSNDRGTSSSATVVFP